MIDEQPEYSESRESVRKDRYHVEMSGEGSNNGKKDNNSSKKWVHPSNLNNPNNPNNPNNLTFINIHGKRMNPLFADYEELYPLKPKSNINVSLKTNPHRFSILDRGLIYHCQRILPSHRSFYSEVRVMAAQEVE